MRAKLREIKEQLRRRMHEAIPEQGRWLKQVVTGYFAYHAVPTTLGRWVPSVTTSPILWRRTLRRRSQKDGPDVGRDGADRRRLAARTPHPSSVARAALCRQSPEVGAVCPNRARTDLCGGCAVTGIPTAMCAGRPARSKGCESLR